MNFLRTVYFTGAVSLLGSSSALASGYAIQERSVKGLGRAFSGEAAIADDASVLASNPAGLTYLEDNSYSLGAYYIDGHFDAKGIGFLQGPPGIPSEESSIAPAAFLPSLYYSKKINDRWSVGIGAFTNFGLKSEYSEAFALTAATKSSELTTFNINPSVAYKLNDNLSLGAGISAVYAETHLTGGSDNIGRSLDLEGDDWGWSYNLGVLYDNQNGTRIGASYRSSVALLLEGDGENTLDRNIAKTAIEAPAKLPAIIELSVYHEFNPKWAVHADVQYTRWNAFQRLRATTSNGGVEVLNNTENWKNSYKFAVGATHHYSDKLTLRAGVAYDQTPVPSSNVRTLRIPDSDRIWFSCGASYEISPKSQIDFGYTYVKAVDSHINELASGNGAFVGDSTGHSHVLGLGFSGSF